MVVSSRSGHSFTISRAVRSCDVSMRMSSGASTEYENPRSGRSSCIDETPRSSRIASARTPLSESCWSTAPKSPLRRRACTPARFSNRAKYMRAPGSRSIAISFPRPLRSAARSAAWPPAPKVASTTVSPGRTARLSRTSAARTGTWSVALGCKTFGNMLRTPFDLGELEPPSGAIPDLEVVVDTGDDDVAAELCVLEQRGGDSDAPLLVELRLRGARIEEALHPAALLAQRIERSEPALDERAPVLRRIGEEAAVHTARHDDPLGEGLPEAGRQREAVLVIEGVFVLAEKHWGRASFSTTFSHDKPHRPTWQPPRPPEGGVF